MVRLIDFFELVGEVQVLLISDHRRSFVLVVHPRLPALDSLFDGVHLRSTFPQFSHLILVPAGES